MENVFLREGETERESVFLKEREKDGKCVFERRRDRGKKCVFERGRERRKSAWAQEEKNLKSANQFKTDHFPVIKFIEEHWAIQTERRTEQERGHHS